jgi:hypothetical protein
MREHRSTTGSAGAVCLIRIVILMTPATAHRVLRLMELTKVDLSLVDAAGCLPDNRVACNDWETLMRACTTGLDTAKKDQRLICVATSFKSILGSAAGARMTDFIKTCCTRCALTASLYSRNFTTFSR